MELGTRASQKRRDHPSRKTLTAVQLEAGFYTILVVSLNGTGVGTNHQSSIEEVIAGFKNVLMLSALSLFRQKALF